MKQSSDSRHDVVKLLVEFGPWAVLGAVFGGFIGLALGGPGAAPKSVDGVVAATEWSDYVAHSWIQMLIGALLGAVLVATTARFVKHKLRTG
jgi:hypothetical protein